MKKYKLGEILTISSTSITPQAGRTYHLYSLPSFDDGKVPEITKGENIHSNKYVISNRCILFNKLNVRFKRIWKIENNTPNKLCSTEFLPLIIDESIIDYQYCYYLLASDYLTNYLCGINSNTSGSHKRINPDILLNLEVTLPVLDEQKHIGSILANLDRKIALNRSINHNLEAMAKQLYDYWFVQFDFPDENGKPYKSSGSKMVWNEKFKRDIPDGWEVAPLNRELEIKSGYAFKSGSYSSEGMFKIITIKNVQDGYLNISTCECIETLPKDIKKWCILQKGDRLISLTGNCGRVCRVTSEDLLLNQRVGVFCCDGLFSEYFYQFLASDEGNHYCVNLANGAAQANLSPIDLCKMELVYPSRETLSLFNKTVKPIIQQYIANEQKIENFTKLRNDLLPLLMNGQVSVNYDLAND